LTLDQIFSHTVSSMKRLLSVLFFALIFLHTFTPFAIAQTQSDSTTDSARLTTRLEEDVPRTYSTHTQMLILEVLAAASCQLSGIDPINPSGKCLGVDPQTQKIGFVENGGGAIAVVTNLMIFTYDIPVNTHSYAQYAFSDFGIAKSSYAQSAGFESLSPLLPVWVAFRNVVYVLFVVVFMLVGIGIIFRREMGGSKTVMTVQGMIPKVVIVIVLVTFSFAIGGFLVDLMYLTMYLMYGIVSTIPGVNIPGLSPSGIIGSTPFGAVGGMGGIGDLATNASRGLGSQISSIFDGGFGTTLAVIASIPLMLVTVMSGPIGWVTGAAGLLGAGVFGVGVSGYANEMIGAIGGLLAFLIIVIAILSALFRLWITLLKSYLFILFDIIMAPLWIAASIIPGSPLTAGSWFRHLLKYLAVFPVTFMLFLLGSVMVQLFSAIPENVSVFAPPFIGNSLNAKHLGSLIGLGVILLVPEVLNIVQSVIKAPESKLLNAIPGSLGVATGTIKRFGSPLAKKAWYKDEKTNSTKGFLGGRWSDSRDKRLMQAEQEGRKPRLFDRASGLILGNNRDRETREQRENRIRTLATNFDTNAVNVVNVNNRDNSRIEKPNTLPLTNQEIANTAIARNIPQAQAQTLLNRYTTLINSTVDRINRGQQLTYTDDVFRGLLQSIDQENAYQTTQATLQQQFPTDTPDQRHTRTRNALQQSHPILIHRYDLRDRARERSQYRENPNPTQPNTPIAPTAAPTTPPTRPAGIGRFRGRLGNNNP
jgi:hypothetical protein